MSSQVADALYTDEIPGGSHWSFTVRRGMTLRLIDKDGGLNVGMMFFNPQNTLEKYNAPDTLKCQHTFMLTKGNCLYSDMGRIFCSIVDDTVGWHDTVGGNLTQAMVEARWGNTSYQENRNAWNQNGRDSFMIEAVKYGMTKRDLVAPANWFSKIQTDAHGNMSFVSGNSKAGDYIDLRFEMDTLVLFHTCPHPMNMAETYPKGSLIYQFFKAPPVTADDYCRTFRPENGRGFKNTELYNACAPVSGA